MRPGRESVLPISFLALSAITDPPLKFLSQIPIFTHSLSEYENGCHAEFHDIG